MLWAVGVLAGLLVARGCFLSFLDYKEKSRPPAIVPGPVPVYLWVRKKKKRFTLYIYHPGVRRASEWGSYPTREEALSEGMEIGLRIGRGLEILESIIP